MLAPVAPVVHLPLGFAVAAMAPLTVQAERILGGERARALARLLAPGAVPLLGVPLPGLADADAQGWPGVTPAAVASGVPVRTPALEAMPAALPALSRSAFARLAPHSGHGSERKDR
eukprot:CAMPEP_0204314190 /NCGR_PEP_ID=MMETSP0469-20131031/4064_1 /ASSEMBLY_ACC=CAM_ASM_000384 /TAXON_ID=2969 /ORGANISM="Oxyrrhis marina" /LENGTH=116 /DNA_ID=CAMNT_0051294629 /DNA_START=79 /DNA_END=425 /DNA_ORIENTATION=+